jgi:hypothetical protein
MPERAAGTLGNEGEAGGAAVAVAVQARARAIAGGQVVGVATDAPGALAPWSARVVLLYIRSTGRPAC